MVECSACKGTLYTACEVCGKYLTGEPSQPLRDAMAKVFYVKANYGRQGRGDFFCTHSCYRCKDGLKPCVSKPASSCEYPHARND